MWIVYCSAGPADLVGLKIHEAHFYGKAQKFCDRQNERVAREKPKSGIVYSVRYED